MSIGRYSEPPFIGSNQKITICGYDTHGANIVIAYDAQEFRHLRVGTAEITRPRVELFPDGARIGCAFVTAEALSKIATEHAVFLVSRSKVLQAGNGEK